MQELRKMIGWLEANPKKRKTKQGVLRFVTAWLAREQDKGRAAPIVLEQSKKGKYSEIYDKVKCKHQ